MKQASLRSTCTKIPFFHFSIFPFLCAAPMIFGGARHSSSKLGSALTCTKIPFYDLIYRNEFSKGCPFRSPLYESSFMGCARHLQKVQISRFFVTFRCFDTKLHGFRNICYILFRNYALSLHPEISWWAHDVARLAEMKRKFVLVIYYSI